MNPYEDIINTPYPLPTRRKRMSMKDRAVQFAPFSALTGYDELIEDAERQMERGFSEEGELM